MLDSFHSALILDLCSSFWKLVQVCTHDEMPWDYLEACRFARDVLRIWLQLEKNEENDEDAYYTTWHAKPKVHMLVHLVVTTSANHGCPSSYWNYLDESYGGKLARRCVSRGGAFNGPLQSKRVLVSALSLKELL